MKAIRIHDFGNSDELKLEQVPLPVLNDNQILVEIVDAGVNPIDWKIRANLYEMKKATDLPMILGQDFAGVVSQVGRNVQDFKKDDRVFGFAQDGSYVEYSITERDSIALLPDSIDFVTGAAIPTPGLTAWQMVVDTAQIGESMHVLILGAAGAVGTFAVQLSKCKNARVSATSSGQDAGYLRDIGADQVFDKNEDLSSLSGKLDAVIDLVGGEASSRSIALIKKGGIIVSSTHSIVDQDTQAAGVRGINFSMKRDARELHKLARLVTNGILKPRISQVINLDRARLAQEMSESGEAHGKIVLQVADIAS